MNQLENLTISQAHQLLKKREFSSVELTGAYIDRVEKVENHIQALVTQTAEVAMQQAARADERIAKDDIGPLTGIPGIIKDVICTKGIRTTCSSKMLENFIPPYNAAVIERLEAAGMVMMGKANMDEFAMGSSNENSAFFPTRNPWDITRVPGGSSGGSAASVAAGEALYSLGSDTGGSIRLPASFCNLVGLKPTYGRVSRYGLVAFASSLDQIGPFARTVTDAAMVFSTIAGFDERDSTSVNQRIENFTDHLDGDIRGMKIGVPKEYFVEGMQPGVKQSIEDAIRNLEQLGAIVDRSASLPSTPYALAVYYILAPSEASANLARYDGVKYGYAYPDSENMWEVMEKTREFGFGPEVKRRIMLGTYALSAGYYDAYYLKAQKVRTIICREFSTAFEKYDALVAPTAPCIAFKMGEKLDDPMQMYLTDVCTLPINIAGIPAISIPAGFSEGMPVGLQIMAKPFNEDALFRIGYAYEQSTDWHKQRPSLPI
ncbi:MAG: Asp-tRNA(Asn)/Glu-tRNA(Gln) amidotransferase subunit GatA [Dehalococcoidales bacterium]|nr:Asp-tRNA(Asn)/Glu-tRNA(Gln) amidotransferase subunit GatA [Dehalococcoidales bacterium]MDD3264802.1 Asp-tRNA(Asn)/Glu-tRNA(Gln) amidotransferase subunit GatA [Dehalococcoidales bacterium]MDD4322255.1 Asp-tRNA(Asn)/Glu-tRNA(Gln) amidotransferase subunit GatA [Dehalococcoidales bacterium]MDD4794433.1 Asp-tRNA(Asn)/Glu-tRNA(Gln) amidotransferase subunit GatA [Dehalococcoidales bacterium]MDD5498104.1 Asp-tRNA(Asn)/Glu-tRNA(Gln) amidotransferase subunit GatA [Dehalococcoidales bacterium]